MNLDAKNYLVPNVVERTPPYVDDIIPGTPAQKADLKPDDLIVFVDGIPFVSATQSVGDVAYGWALEDTTGLLTVHADLSGRVLAAHAIGPHASTLVQPLIQAATFGQHATDVARGQYWIHPALAEVVENALLGLPFPSA